MLLLRIIVFWLERWLYKSCGLFWNNGLKIEAILCISKFLSHRRISTPKILIIITIFRRIMIIISIIKHNTIILIIRNRCTYSNPIIILFNHLLIIIINRLLFILIISNIQLFYFEGVFKMWWIGIIIILNVHVWCILFIGFNLFVLIVEVIVEFCFHILFIEISDNTGSGSF